MVCGGLLRNRTIHRYGYLFTYPRRSFFPKKKTKKQGMLLQLFGGYTGEA